MISTLLDKITSTLNSNDLIQSVYGYEPDGLNGDPVAIVVPSGNESDYKTTNENERLYAFNVKLLVARTVRTTDEADRVLRNLVSSVLDSFDKDYYFSGISCPQGYTMINVFALPSQWGYTGGESQYRVAEIVVKCRVYVDVTKIS